MSSRIAALSAVWFLGDSVDSRLRLRLVGSSVLVGFWGIVWTAGAKSSPQISFAFSFLGDSVDSRPLKRSDDNSSANWFLGDSVDSRRLRRNVLQPSSCRFLGDSVDSRQRTITLTGLCWSRFWGIVWTAGARLHH